MSPRQNPHSPPKTTAAHGTSSAFSASAQPHEDWTKISDLAERRRIQNRIAQRNYRKKIRQRLEDAEKQSSTSSSPEHSPRESSVPQKPTVSRQLGEKRQSLTRDLAPHEPHMPSTDALVTSYVALEDGTEESPARETLRNFSASPTLTNDFSAGSSTSVVSSFYPSQIPLDGIYPPTNAFPDSSKSESFIDPMPSTLPSMGAYDSLPSKPGNFFDDTNTFSQCGASYGSLAGIDAPIQGQFQDTNLNVNIFPEYTFLQS